MWTLIPAYGRDYKSKTAVLADYNANKDFICVADPDGLTPRDLPINKQDLEFVATGSTAKIRYSGKTKVMFLTI